MATLWRGRIAAECAPQDASSSPEYSEGRGMPKGKYVLYLYPAKPEKRQVLYRAYR